MSSCLETDAVVGLAQLADDPLELIRHALDCERCRETLAEVAVLRREGGATAVVRAGFTDDVMAALSVAAEPSRSPSAGASWVWWPVQAVLAAGVAFFIAAAAGAAAPGGGGPSVLLACALVGGASLIAPRLLSP